MGIVEQRCGGGICVENGAELIKIEVADRGCIIELIIAKAVRLQFRAGAFERTLNLVEMLPDDVSFVSCCAELVAQFQVFRRKWIGGSVRIDFLRMRSRGLHAKVRP